MFLFVATWACTYIVPTYVHFSAKCKTDKMLDNKLFFVSYTHIHKHIRCASPRHTDIHIAIKHTSNANYFLFEFRNFILLLTEMNIFCVCCYAIDTHAFGVRWFLDFENTCTLKHQNCGKLLSR